ncbi:MAG: formate dehydrogenase accessory protein FdhE [Chloroflexi bacterium]|nr:formate dehydrogenase accessory protein FdhE [Chloroflexota bacterium]
MAKQNKTTDPLTQRLGALAQAQPAMQAIADYYRVILPLINHADLAAAPLNLSREAAQEKLNAGIPLLHNEPLEFDHAAARALMLALARAAEKGQPAAREIRAAVEQNKMDWRGLLAAIVAGDTEAVNAIAQSLHLDSNLLWTLAQNTFKPALRAWHRQLSDIVRADEWRKSYCFICGAVPVFGELQGNDQARHLRCGQCGADWFYERMRCVYCGRSRELNFLYVEAQRDRMHAQACDHCKGYIKNVAAFSPTPTEMLAVVDLETLLLDYSAQDHGYARQAIREFEEIVPVVVE